MAKKSSGSQKTLLRKLGLIGVATGRLIFDTFSYYPDRGLIRFRNGSGKHVFKVNISKELLQKIRKHGYN